MTTPTGPFVLRCVCAAGCEAATRGGPFWLVPPLALPSIILISVMGEIGRNSGLIASAPDGEEVRTAVPDEVREAADCERPSPEDSDLCTGMMSVLGCNARINARRVVSRTARPQTCTYMFVFQTHAAEVHMHARAHDTNLRADGNRRRLDWARPLTGDRWTQRAVVN